MNTRRWTLSISAFLSALIICGAVSSTATAASSGPYYMEVLIDGRPASEYYHQGKTYVEAEKQHEYAVRLTNMSSSRVAVALSIDGLNTIDAKHSSAYDARKWVIDPYESVIITGWQTSSYTARQFYFTSEASSYGAWLGKTRDLGNISAAFFREIEPEPPVWIYEDYDYLSDYSGTGAGEWEGAERSESRRAKEAPSASESADASAGLSSRPSRRQAAKAAPRDDYAATGIGREQGHSVYTVEFQHETSPAAVVTMRYEFRDTLVKLGVLPRPYQPNPVYRRETSSGFTDYGFAPDPYGGR